MVSTSSSMVLNLNCPVRTAISAERGSAGADVERSIYRKLARSRIFQGRFAVDVPTAWVQMWVR